MSARRLQLWPWALALPPLLAVAGGIAMIVLAVHTPSALVVDDYARIEELTSERFALDQAAARLGVEARLDFGSGRIDVELAGVESGPEQLLLRLQHATDAARDHELMLVRSGDSYTVAADIAPGRYRIELLPPDRGWRLASGIVRAGGAVALRPQAQGG